MKARDFAYKRADSISEAVSLLVDHDGAAVVLAGGQSLLAGLNLRLSAPELVIDISGLESLKGISLQDDVVRIGALTRHVDVLRSDIIREHLPLMSEAVTWVAHAGVRNRGTIGGSVAYADPSAELPACIVALDATIVTEGPQGQRRHKAEGFFEGLFSTILQIGEIITEFLIPVQKPESNWAFLELSRRHGDFAMAGIVLTATSTDSGNIEAARVVYFGCNDHPALATATATALLNTPMSSPRIDEILASVEADLQLEDTPGYRADTKLRLAKTVTRRAVEQMGARKTGNARSRPTGQEGLNE